jgi:hypothetical protein
MTQPNTPEVQQVPEIQIVINFIQGQPVQVFGPLWDKVLCYGLLEVAKDAIRDYKPPQIEVAPPGLLDQIKWNGRQH